MNKTPYRPNVGGLTTREYAHIGTPDLRTWQRYWEEVRDRERKPNPGDRVEMAHFEVAKLSREIEAREDAGYAGPNRYRTWA